MIPSKGVHLLVEAFNRLARPDLRLRIHGEAPAVPRRHDVPRPAARDASPGPRRRVHRRLRARAVCGPALGRRRARRPEPLVGGVLPDDPRGVPRGRPRGRVRHRGDAGGVRARSRRAAVPRRGPGGPPPEAPRARRRSREAPRARRRRSRRSGRSKPARARPLGIYERARADAARRPAAGPPGPEAPSGEPVRDRVHSDLERRARSSSGCSTRSSRRRRRSTTRCSSSTRVAGRDGRGRPAPAAGEARRDPELRVQPRSHAEPRRARGSRRDRRAPHSGRGAARRGVARAARRGTSTTRRSRAPTATSFRARTAIRSSGTGFAAGPGRAGPPVVKELPRPRRAREDAPLRALPPDRVRRRRLVRPQVGHARRSRSRSASSARTSRGPSRRSSRDGRS